MKRNYQKELEGILGGLDSTTKRILLHSCCAPCSSYVIAYLKAYFALTVFYYNPNIAQSAEYNKRAEEQKRLIRTMNEEAWPGSEVSFREGPYEPERFYEAVKGLENCPEGSERCFRCYELRLREAAAYAKAEGFDYVTTTLTISPLKNADKLNEIGERLAEEYGVAFLPSDFKKKDGYKQSVALSQQYELYRQDFCGCIYSQIEAEQRAKQEMR